jgi:5-methyltetrahydropteroyltriglutamate--homocysteine methyltransferase
MLIGRCLDLLRLPYSFILSHTGMKKWITSNYHYMVPEWDEGNLEPDFDSFLSDVRRGLSFLGAGKAVPVVIGPVTIAYLTKISSFSPGYETEKRRELLKQLLPIYKELLSRLSDAGVKEIQVHEAVIVFEDPELLPLFKQAYPLILPTGVAINLVSYMESPPSDHYQWLVSVKEIDILSLDLTRGSTLSLIKQHGFPSNKVLGAGLIDARNVWKFDPQVIRQVLLDLAKNVENVRIQPSSSLQYNPWSLVGEDELLTHPAGPVLSFATEKLSEITFIAKAASDDAALNALDMAWSNYRKALSSSAQCNGRLKNVKDSDFCRAESFEKRRPKQLKDIPILPTTTIGSFPQTRAIRLLRTQYKNGSISKDQYEHAIDQQIAYAIGIQECLGLDIFVHGEAERTDMVEFFGKQLDGILFTCNGWVQSFGSRCVRPPVIWSDIVRPHPMTVREFVVAQALTEKPVKGMLTGPVTILNWSFPRSDISRKEQAMQLALCIRDEIVDLEQAGCRVIQVDEPALREAMPLRAEQKQEYLDWAVDSFRLATGVAASETQIHTHMCYCEFDDCMEAIDRMDTDVNSIENARSDNATLVAFDRIGYTKDLGPGTYDIHSPVVPTVDFIRNKLKSFIDCINVESLVVNPDCGLKTRTWPETTEALKNMVEATRLVREEISVR